MRLSSPFVQPFPQPRVAPRVGYEVTKRDWRGGTLARPPGDPSGRARRSGSVVGRDSRRNLEIYEYRNAGAAGSGAGSLRIFVFVERVDVAPAGCTPSRAADASIFGFWFSLRITCGRRAGPCFPVGCVRREPAASPFPRSARRRATRTRTGRRCVRKRYAGTTKENRTGSNSMPINIYGSRCPTGRERRRIARSPSRTSSWNTRSWRGRRTLLGFRNCW